LVFAKRDSGVVADNGNDVDEPIRAFRGPRHIPDDRPSHGSGRLGLSFRP